MHTTIGITSRTAAAVAALLTLAACGNSNGSGSGGGSASGDTGTPAAGGGASTGVHVGHTSLGDVLVDGSGRTVYLLTADGAGRSTCAGACASQWPPVEPGKGTGLSAKVASTKTPDGAPIITVGGTPLYTYAGDQGTGDVNGEEIRSYGGTWYAVTPAGTKVEPESGGSDDSGQDSGGYGY